MRIHVGCELTFEFPRTTPMIAMLNVHFSRVSDLERPDHLMPEQMRPRMPTTAPPLGSSLDCREELVEIDEARHRGHE